MKLKKLISNILWGLTVLRLCTITSISFRGRSLRSADSAKNMQLGGAIKNISATNCIEKEYFLINPDRKSIQLPPNQKIFHPIVLLFTTDVHGHIEHLSKLIGYKNKLIQSGYRVVIVNGGDMSISTAFSRKYGDAAVGNALSMSNVQAMAVGNHDLEYRSALPVTFPIISINIPGFNKSTIVKTIDGIRIGFIGYTWIDSINERSIVDAIKLEAERLRQEEAVHLVIVLGHGGTKIDLFLLSQFCGLVDAILGGHSHDVVSCNGLWHSNDQVLLHCGHSGTYICTLRINLLNNKKGFSFASDATPVRLINATDDPDMKHWIDAKLGGIKLDHEKLASSSKLLDNRNCRKSACMTGKIITTAIKRYFDNSSFVALESGSIRGRFHADISVEDLSQILPWNNQLVQYQLQGKDLIAFLDFSEKAIFALRGAYMQTSDEYYLEYNELDGRLAGYIGTNYQDIFRLNPDSTIDSEKSCTVPGDEEHLSARRNRLTSLNLQRKLITRSTTDKYYKIQYEQWYNIIVSEWIECGGDGYMPFLQPATKIKRSVKRVRDIVHDYLKWNITEEEISMLHQQLSSEPITKDGKFEPLELSTNQTESSNSVQSANLSYCHYPHYFVDMDGVPSTGISNANGLKGEAGSGEPRETRGHGSFWVHGLVGVLAEFSSVLITYPLITRVTLMQTKLLRNSPHHERKSTYHGVMLLIFTRFVNTIVYWNGYYFVKFSLESTFHSLHLNSWHNGVLGFASGVIAGVFNTIVTNPLWVMVTYVQVHGCYPEECQSLSNGLGTGLLLVSHPSIRQFVFEYFSYMYDSFPFITEEHLDSTPSSLSWIQSTYHDLKHPLMHGFIGLMATVIATVITYPLQLLRTRLLAGIKEVPTKSHQWFSGLFLKLICTMAHEFLFFFFKKCIEMYLLGVSG